MKRSDIKNYFYNTIIEQNKTKCLTSGAVFNTKITESNVTVSVDIPFNLNLSEKEAEILETLLHNAIETVLRPYFNYDLEKSDYPLE